ncbi:MAG: (2Fe-2S)-binding protein [Chloroflexi bacterium 44-23]|nr:MAG: (2Fe-2S)-binding protein [Chloroflexi bacterium 44-23]
MYSISLIVNQKPYSIKVLPEHTLLDVLRDQLDITGPKECCGVGECGACTILMNGKAVNACLILAVEADGSNLVTIEGLGGKDNLSPLQQAFVDAGAVQCGFCTPGMIMAAQYLINTNPNPTEEDVRLGLEGNLCRCTGYSRIIQAVLSVAQNKEHNVP